MKCVFRLLYKFTFTNSCLLSTVSKNWHVSLCSKGKKQHLSQPCSSSKVQDQNSSCFLKNNRHSFNVKNPHSQLSSGLHDNLLSTIKIFSNIQDAYSLNWPYTRNTEHLSKSEDMQRFINCKTTDVMDDFMPPWKVKQSALWNTELLCSIKREDVKYCVESHFKESRHPVSAFSFIAIEKVSLGPGGGDLNFIRKEKERPFGTLLFKSLNPRWINGETWFLNISPSCFNMCQILNNTSWYHF